MKADLDLSKNKMKTHFGRNETTKFEAKESNFIATEVV